MFEIYGGAQSLKQWDKNQKLIVEKLRVGSEVNFYNDPYDDDPISTAVYEIQNGDKTYVVCDIPNILLTEAKKFKACVPEVIPGPFGNNYRISGSRERYFEVEPAEKPADYVYEETPLEDESCSCDFSEDDVEEAVKQYIAENGIPNDDIIALL